MSLFVLPTSAIANQESLSGLETEMRKLEGIVKEIVDEMDYLKTREERFQLTNSASLTPFYSRLYRFHFTFLGMRSTRLTYSTCSVDKRPRTELRLAHVRVSRRARRLADPPPPLVLQAEVSH